MTTAQINAERLAKLDSLVLKHGSHPTAEAGMCFNEAAAWLAGEKHSDAPDCVCPVIRAATMRLNDRIKDDALRTELLRPLLVKAIGTRSTREVMIKRGFIAADFACRVFLPMRLEARGKKADAEECRAAFPITDRSSAITARDRIRAKYAAADAAAAAAYAADAAAAAAYAAYADAAAAYAYADAAAADAAADADASAASAAAAYTAADAAYTAADAAADAADAADARKSVYVEGVRMIEVMIAVTE